MATTKTPSEVQSLYEKLGEQFGFTTTSTTRSAEENKRVGGVATSQHLDTIGTARDWSVKGKTPAQVEAFASALREQGFEVITKPHGTGPHVHAELPGKSRPSAVQAATDEVVSRMTFDQVWGSSQPRPADVWNTRIDPLAESVKKALPAKAPEWARNAATAVKRAALARDMDISELSQKLQGNEVQAAIMAPQADAQVPFADGADQEAVREEVNQGQIITDREQQDATLGQFARRVLLENNLTAALIEGPPEYVKGKDYNDKVDYLQYMDEWEKGRTSDEVARLRAIGTGDFVKGDIHRELERQDKEREAQKDYKGFGTAATVGASLLAGIVDPVGVAAGFGSFKAFEVAGLSARAALKAGQVAKGIALGSAESAAGNVLVTGGMDLAGHQYSASDYVLAASFGAALGVPFTAIGVKGARIEGAMEAHAKMLDDAKVAVQERMERFQVAARQELGPDADEAAVVARAGELDVEESLSGVRETSSGMRDEDRFYPEVDEMAEPEAPKVGAADNAEPVLGDMTVRRENGERWTESKELRAGIDAAEQSGKASDLFRVVAGETGTPEPFRALGARLAELADTVKLGYVAARELTGEAATWGGVYFRDTHHMSVGQAKPEFILHEGVHGITSNILATPKANLPEAMRAGVQRVEDLLAHVQAHIGMSGMEIPEKLKGLVEDGRLGPLANSQEFLAYGMTNTDFQKFLSAIPAMGGKVKNAWDWFKNAISDLLGLKGNERTALDELLESGGELLDQVRDNPDSPAIIGRESQRATDMAAATRDAAVLPDEATLLPPGAVLRTTDAVKAILTKYGLDATISDATERRIAAEMYARAERILARVPINKERLKPLLSKVGWEATSTRLLLSENPLARATGVMLLENPEGAAGRRLTASVTAHVKDRIYRGSVEPEYENLLVLYAKGRGKSQIAAQIDPKIKQDFDKAVQKEMVARWQNQPATTDNAAVRKMADVFDTGYRMMASDAVASKIIGYARLPVGKSGYFPRILKGDRLVALTTDELRTVEQLLSDEFQITAGWDRDFSDKFAVKYMEIARDNVRNSKMVTLDMRSPDTADVVRDSLKAMGLSEEEMQKVLARFSRGGAKMTRSRIDIDLNATKVMPDGTEFRLGDLFEDDMISMYKNYSRRMSGEVALTQFGIMGAPGAKMLYKAVSSGAGEFTATAKELESLNQVLSEFLGMRVGNSGDSLALTNLRAFASAVYLGGMGWTQFTEYGNAIHAVGFGGMVNAITSIPRMYGEIQAKLKGKPVENGILDSLELPQFLGDIGTEQYRIIGLREAGNNAEVYGQNQLGVFSLAVRGARHAVRVLSMQRAIEAVQVRGLSEQIARKAFRYVREGREDLALNDMGMTPELRAVMLRNMDATTTWDGSSLKSLDLTKWDDQLAARTFAALVERGSSQIIQRSYVGEVGSWVHSDHLRLLTQFRDYPLIATQKQWRRVSYSQGTWRAVGYILGSLSVTLPIYYARVGLGSIGKDEEWVEQRLSPLAVGQAAMRYTSALGLTSDAFDVISAPLGLTPYAGRSGVTGSIPALSLLDKTAKVAGYWPEGMTMQQKARDAYSVLPGNGIQPAQGLMQWMLSEDD